MSKKAKKYLAVLDLTYNYDDSMIDEWRDDSKELSLLDADSVRWEIMSWLEDLGFTVEVRVIEDKEV